MLASMINYPKGRHLSFLGFLGEERGFELHSTSFSSFGVSLKLYLSFIEVQRMLNPTINNRSFKYY